VYEIVPLGVSAAAGAAPPVLRGSAEPGAGTVKVAVYKIVPDVVLSGALPAMLSAVGAAATVRGRVVELPVRKGSDTLSGMKVARIVCRPAGYPTTTNAFPSRFGVCCAGSNVHVAVNTVAETLTTATDPQLRIPTPSMNDTTPVGRTVPEVAETVAVSTTDWPVIGAGTLLVRTTVVADLVTVCCSVLRPELKFASPL